MFICICFPICLTSCKVIPNRICPKTSDIVDIIFPNFNILIIILGINAYNKNLNDITGSTEKFMTKKDNVERRLEDLAKEKDNLTKKIESSEMTMKTLASYKYAMDRYTVFKDTVHVHMNNVDNPDILVIIVDFFMRLAEVTWSIVSGIYGDKVVIVARNVGFRGDAGKKLQKLFGDLGGSAGGHRSAARAEIPLKSILPKGKSPQDLGAIIHRILKTKKMV